MLEEVQTSLDALARLQQTLGKVQQQQQQRGNTPPEASPKEREEGGTEKERMKVKAGAVFRVGKEVTEDQIAAAEHLLRACEDFRMRLLKKQQRAQQQQQRQQQQGGGGGGG